LHSEILFLFEPDQGLDSLARYNLSKKLLEANSKGTTIIIFTSSGENELLKISDSIYKLEGGKISK
jgi:ABC-type sugar transport system ATPase subunit